YAERQRSLPVRQCRRFEVPVARALNCNRNFRSEAALRDIISSALLLPKFVEGAAMEYELRKQGTRAATAVADSTGNWVDTIAPPGSRPYLRLARLDRPIGSWLLLMPCWWSVALAAGVAHELKSLPLYIALFFVGSFAMRGAGCTWNDITDRDLDARVERTRSRPIPAGQVSVAQAFAFLVAQALI